MSIVTKATARAFCAAYNRAWEGQTIFINAAGSVTIDEMTTPWMNIKKQKKSFDSTEEAFEFLKKCESDAVKHLNARLAERAKAKA